MKHPIIDSIEQLRVRHKKPENPNKLVEESMTKLDRFALMITEKVGSIGFFFLVFLWTIVWLGWNTLGPKEMRFDPFPAFVFWLFISNVLQIFLMPLIMVGQNLQSKHSEIRAESDFEINTKAEQEIETILMHLENQNEMILKILKTLGQAPDSTDKK